MRLLSLWLPLLVLPLAVVPVLFTYFLGIYPDEVAFKLFLERYFLAEGIRQGLFPYCTSGFMRPTPITLIPAGIVWSSLTMLGDGFLSYRALPWLGIAFLYGVIVRENRQAGSRHFWPILLLISLGPVLYGLIILRPEIITLALAAALYLLGLRLAKTRQPYRRWLLLIAMLILYSMGVYVHAKMIFLAILPLVALLLSLRQPGSLAERAVCALCFIAAFAGVTWQAIDLQQQLAQCPEVPALAQVNGGYSANPLDLFRNPPHFFRELIAAQETLITQGYKKIFYLSAYELPYLPPTTPTAWVQAGNVAIGIAIGFAIMTLVALAAATVWQHRHRRTARGWLLITLALALLAPFMLNKSRFFYEIAYGVGSLMVLLGLLWPLAQGRTQQWIGRFCLPLLVPIAALCLFVTATSITQQQAAGFRGVNIPFFTNRGAWDARIREALAQHGVTASESLIIDEVAYDTLKHHPTLISTAYYLYGRRFTEAATLLAPLQRHDVRHGLVECRHVPSLAEIFSLTVLEVLPPAYSNDYELCLIARG